MSENNSISSHEEWKVLDFNTRYAVSDMGQVQRIEKGNGTSVGRILKPRKSRKGYTNVALFSGTLASRKQYPVHRLVLHVFVGAIPTGYEVNHKNGVKDDNRLENLEYVTPSENVQHAFKYLNHAIMRGDLNGHAILTESNALEVKRLIAIGAKGRDIAKQMGISVSTVSAIKHKRIWKHLPD